MKLITDFVVTEKGESMKKIIKGLIIITNQTRGFWRFGIMTASRLDGSQRKKQWTQ